MSRKLKEAEYKLKSELTAVLFPEKCAEAEKLKDKKKIFVLLGGYYQNLGDLAITVAQTEFLKKSFPDYEVIAVPSTKTYQYMKSIKRSLTDKDIITVSGGGNMSDGYVSLEYARRFAVRNLKNNPVVSFPQTFDFSNSYYGRHIKNGSVKIYNSNKNFYAFAREGVSFSKMKQCFENSVGLCPDIVLSLDKSAPQTQRNGILCCFRKDKELSVSKQFTDEVSSALSGKREVTFKDTVDVALEDCMPENAEKTLNGFLDLIKSKELVVTDRLHCMIFCVITKTPCIAFDNSNGKISAVIESWLKNCSYVRLSDSKDINGVMKDVEEMLALDADRYERFDLTEKFRPITDLINKFIN